MEKEIKELADLILPEPANNTWVTRTIALEISKDIWQAGYRRESATLTAVAECLQTCFDEIFPIPVPDMIPRRKLIELYEKFEVLKHGEMPE